MKLMKGEKYMKLFRYSLIILLISIVLDCVMCFAYASPNATGISVTLKTNNSQFTSYRTKNVMSSQYYENTFASTLITNPCTKCKIMVKPYTEDGDTYAGVLTTMGNKYRFPDDFSKQPNNYRLNIWRYDVTAMDTQHTGVWTIN